MDLDYSPTQAAAQLGLSDRSIRRRIKDGKLQAEHLEGIGYRIRQSEIDRYRTRYPDDHLEEERPIEPMLTDDLDEEGEEIVAKAALSQERALTRARVARRRERAIARHHLTYEDLLRAIQLEALTGPKIEVTPPQPRISGKPIITPVLLLSDLHGGACYERDASGGLIEFDYTLFGDRILRLTEAVLEIIDAQRSFHTINRLVIAWGGDNFEGRTIFEGQDRETLGLVRQFRLTTQVMHEALLVPLARAVPQIIMKQVPGNHGRLGSKEQNLDPVQDSLDVLWMDYLQLRAQDIPNIQWDHTEGRFKLFKLHGWQFLLHHGDLATGGAAHTPTTRARQYKRDFESVAHTKIDVSLSGHLHGAGMALDGFSTNITNGCVPGGSPYSVDLGYNSPPIQTLITVSDRFPVHSHWPIWLATRDECLTVEADDLDQIAL